jgi:outer membrane immunogenic protein
MKTKLALIGGAMLLSTSAFAADLPMEAAPAVVAVPSFSWTGGYIGAQAGYAWGDANFRAAGGSLSAKPKGWMVGGYAGYNVQLDNSLVLGVETDFNWADIDRKRGAFGATAKTDIDWTGATRARVGFAVDRVLFYAAGGVAYARREVKVSGFGLTAKDRKTAVGWTIGGGVESAVTENVVVRAEYRYTDLGKDTFRLAGVPVRSKYDEHRVMAGVAYKFGW